MTISQMITLLLVGSVFCVIYYTQRIIRHGYNTLKKDIQSIIDKLDNIKDGKDKDVIEIDKEDIKK